MVLRIRKGLSLLLAVALMIPFLTSGGGIASAASNGWERADGGSANGLNVNTAQNASSVDLAVFRNGLYGAWLEAGTFSFSQLRVRMYDGTSWKTVDGGGTYGLNAETGRGAYSPKLVVFDNTLYLAWDETNATASQIRLKKYNGTTWSSADGGSTNGLNVNVKKNAASPDLAVFNNVMYLAWSETGSTSARQIRVKKYDGVNWTSADSGGVDGINWKTANDAYGPKLAVANGSLYAMWVETNASYSKIRVKKYNGTGWDSVDGNDANGLNISSSQYVDSPSMVSFNNELYIAWGEYNGSIFQIRAKKFNGTSWEIVDGGSLNRESSKSATSPDLTVYNNSLYAVWSENNQIRVKKYDGTSWKSADGDGTSGLNVNSGQSTDGPKLGVFKNALFAVWSEGMAFFNQQKLFASRYTAPTTANAANNIVSASPSTVTAGSPVTLTATGDRQSEAGVVEDDEKYIPLSWSSTESGKTGTFALSGGNYTSTYTPSTAGNYTVTVTFMKQVWIGDGWENQGDDTKTTAVTVNAAAVATTANAANNSVSASPSTVTAGSPVTLTATGDRQSEAGVVEDDEKYIPLSWSSTESGKTGTFALSGGNYTSTYTPSTAGNYTVTVTFMKQVWIGDGWENQGDDTKTTAVTVNAAAVATTANAANNSVSASPSTVTAGSPVTLTATGDRQSEAGVVEDDEKYIPLSWSSTESGKTGTFALDGGNYTSTYTPSTAGNYTVTVTFMKQVWIGDGWENQGDDTKTTAVTVNAAAVATTANAANNSVSASPSTVTAGSPVTLTATGDRQSEAGVVEDDEKYIPLSWSSTESGKTGTFALDGGNYTSTYTPSTAGNYTVTVTFMKQVWIGDGWENQGDDTKTTAVTVNAAATTADPANNSVYTSTNYITAGNSVMLSVYGDRQSAKEEDAVIGDERYFPISWSSTEAGKSGTFTPEGVFYVSTYTPSAAGNQTVTVTFVLQKWDGNVWKDSESTDTKTTLIMVSPAPTPANAANNTVGASPGTVTLGASVTLTASGDRQNVEETVRGDERYVPESWSSTESGKTSTFALDGGNYTSTYTPSTAGNYTVTVIFKKQKRTNEGWEDIDQDTKTTAVTVNAAATTADPANNSVYTSTNYITAGNSVMLSVYGDRQSAKEEDAVIGDERYFPISWSSTEAGKSGTFTPEGVFYVSMYTPSAAGNQTVTVTFVLQKWDGNVWKDSESTDTKTTLIMVSPAPTPANAANNTVGASPGTVTLGASVTLTASGDRQNVEETVRGDERYVPESWSSTESGKTGTFALDGGNYTSTYTPSTAGNYTVTVIFKKQKRTNEGWEDIDQDTKSTTVTVGSGSGSSSGGDTSTLPSSGDTAVIVLVNGKSENIGTAKTDKRNEQTVTTIRVDEKKLDDKLATEGQYAVVTIPVSVASDIVIGELNGQMIKNMENRQAVLEVQTDQATYTLPAREINIDAIFDKIGKTVTLQDILVRIEIAATPANMVKVVENAAAKGSFSIVVPSLDFTVSAIYGDQAIEVLKYNVYVERTIAIPDGVDPNKITTGVVVDPDGTVRHVPTKVVVIDGKYYAKVNSLTNSTYSIVWHPLEFSDAAKHWAKEAVNDMGSRMVIEGTGEGLFSPDRAITRAEFAAILVRGLGLKPETGAATFSDVKVEDWYHSAVSTAYTYRLIDGFDDGTFRPNEQITREQAMKIISKAMVITGLKAKLIAQSADASLRSFEDASSVAAWARSGAADSVQAGIVTGRSADTLAPKAYMTRAEVAAMMQRLLQKSDLI